MTKILGSRKGQFSKSNRYIAPGTIGREHGKGFRSYQPFGERNISTTNSSLLSAGTI